MQELKDKRKNFIIATFAILLTILKYSLVGLIGVGLNYFMLKYGWHAISGHYPEMALAKAMFVTLVFVVSSRFDGIVLQMRNILSFVCAILFLLGLWDFFFGTIFGK